MLLCYHTLNFLGSLNVLFRRVILPVQWLAWWVTSGMGVGFPGSVPGQKKETKCLKVNMRKITV